MLLDVLISSAVALLCGVATWIDLRSRVIPNTIPVILLVGTGLLVAMQIVPWVPHVIGLGIGTLFGLVIYRTGGFGGGDVKLLIATCAALGLDHLPTYLLGVAVAGGVLSLIALIRKQREFAYGPSFAIAAVIVAGTELARFLAQGRVA